MTVRHAAWSLFGRAFGPRCSTPLRIALLADGGVQVTRADGRRIGHIARTCREQIEQARVELLLQRERELATATRRSVKHTPTRRVEAAIRPTQAAAAPTNAPPADSALEPARPGRESKVASGMFRYDQKTITDRITRLRQQERPEAEPAPVPTADEARRDEQTKALARLHEMRAQHHRDRRDGGDVFADADTAAGDQPPPERTASGMFKYNREQITDRLSRVREKNKSGTWHDNGAEL